MYILDSGWSNNNIITKPRYHSDIYTINVLLHLIAMHILNINTTIAEDVFMFVLCVCGCVCVWVCVSVCITISNIVVDFY